jgi:hypothetical protein
MHGPVADVDINAEHILDILHQAQVEFTAESYGPDDQLLQEWGQD